MNKDREYQRCSISIMDTTDPEITFDDDGICNHVTRFEKEIKPGWFPNEEGAKKLEAIFAEMKRKQKGEYPCIMGLSGGVDSSYLAYIMVKKYGIKPLVVHVDGGWNSEQAVQNIENIVKRLDLDLYTYVVDWGEMRDLQLAFFKSSVANQDIPQDHAFFAKLSQVAREKNIKYVLSGSNYATESILPSAWGYDAMDSKQLKAIHKKFGKVKLKTYPVVSFFNRYFYLPFICRLKTLKPLNYMPYDKEDAMKILIDELGWQYYGGKHYESTFTKFFQSYYLPTKFGYDKRLAHLSSLIVSGQLSRDKALEEMTKPLYDDKEIEIEKSYMARKLGVTVEEFKNILQQPIKTYKDYPNQTKKINLLKRLKRMITNQKI